MKWKVGQRVYVSSRKNGWNDFKFGTYEANWHPGLACSIFTRMPQNDDFFTGVGNQ